MIPHGKQSGKKRPLALLWAVVCLWLFGRLLVMPALADDNSDGIDPFLCALDRAETIQPAYAQSITLALIARKSAQAGRFALALSAADRIGVSGDKARALADIARAQAENGRSNEAYALLKKALTLVSEENQVFLKDLALMEITDGFVACNMHSRAFKSAKSIRTPFLRAKALANAAAASIGSPYKANALGMLDKARAEILKTKGKTDKGSALAHVAKKYAEAGLFDAAVETIDDIENPAAKAEASTGIARRHFVEGRPEEAKRFVDSALTLASTISSSYGKSRILTDIADCLVLLGLESDAADLLDQAYETAVGIKNPMYRDTALIDVAVTYAKAGYENRTFKIAESLDDPASRIRILLKTALNCKENACLPQAEHLLLQCLEWAAKSDKPGQAASLIAEIGHAYASVGIPFDEKAKHVIRRICSIPD